MLMFTDSFVLVLWVRVVGCRMMVLVCVGCCRVGWLLLYWWVGCCLGAR